MTSSGENPPTPELEKALKGFADWRKTHLKGDEKGEAQVFLDRLFQAYGHAGLFEAGATLEMRIKKNDNKGTSFADMVWKPRVLVEMKKAGVNLGDHYQQAFDYWVNALPNRPQYVVLCNFDEFWVYNLNKQVHDPVEKVQLSQLSKHWESLAFLLPEAGTPVFGQDMVAVTEDAASDVAALFRTFVDRGVDRGDAQRFVLQSVLTLFAEDIGLLPSHLYTIAIEQCLEKGTSPHLLLFSLFHEMNTPGMTKGGPFKGTPYFNGGLFSAVTPFDITADELELLHAAALTDWSFVRPAIFGTIFEESLDQTARHTYGQHFTDEADIMRVVGPTISQPWLNKIASANTQKKLNGLENDLLSYRVLDPACGCGNFLYIAYRELRRVEKALSDKRRAMTESKSKKVQPAFGFVTPSHFYGVDVNPFAVEIAKTVLMLAKKLAAVDVGDEKAVLPLDDLSSNFFVADALDPAFAWPKFDACIGNPPYLGRQKLQKERGAKYLHELDSWHPEVSGKADYVSYWFRLAQDRLPMGGRAGFVATNSIREGDTRKATLDYIVGQGATITEAVSSQTWPGTAQVNVSIVNWFKGEQLGLKTLILENGSKEELAVIGPTLSDQIDLTSARPLAANKKPKVCFQGQTTGHESFLLDDDEAAALNDGPSVADVVLPSLTGRDIADSGGPVRWVIDFGELSKAEAAAAAPLAFKHVKQNVLPHRDQAAASEAKANAAALAASPNAKVNLHSTKFLNRWWTLAWPRRQMLDSMAPLSRYIGMSRYAIRNRPSIYAYLDTSIRPLDKVIVFAFDDDYSLGVLQSSLHRRWFENRASLGGAISYTNSTAFDTFPWPQAPSKAQIGAIVEATAAILAHRSTMLAKGISLGAMYDALRSPGKDPLADLHAGLDACVLKAYGFNAKNDPIKQLLELNHALAEREKAGKAIRAPGPSGLGGTNKTSSKITAPPLP